MPVLIKLVLKDIRKNKWKIAIFVFQMLVFLFLLMLALAQFPIISQGIKAINIIKISNLIRQQEIMSFKDYMNKWSEIYIDKDMYYFFEDLFDKGDNAYSVMESAEPIGFSDRFPDVDGVVFAVGKFDEVFGFDKYKPEPKETYVFVGADVKTIDVGDQIELGMYNKQTYTVDARLKKGEAYLNKTHYRSLDNKVLVLTSFRNTTTLYQYVSLRELIPNIHLINPDIQQIDQVIQMANRTKKFALVPWEVSLRDVIKATFQESFLWVMLFACFVVSMCIFMICGFISSIYMLIDHNFVEYAVHQIYGATPQMLYLRIILFVIFIVLLPAAIFYNMPGMKDFMKVSPELKWVWWFMAIFLLIMVVLVSVLAILRLSKKDLTEFLRRDR